MSVRKIVKEKRKVYNRIRGVKLNSDIFLFTDSKGEYLKDFIPSSVKEKFNIVSKRGATVYSRVHKDNLLRQISGVDNPLILVWLGTCEITRKDDKLISLREYPYQNIEFVLNEYRVLKDQIIQANSSAKVLFLDCPYYSITRANKIRSGHINTHNTCSSGKHYPPILINVARESRSVQLKSVVDKQVRKQIDYYNEHLKILNRNVATPRLSQDQILSNKRKKDIRVRYRTNYNLLSDGVHPEKIIAKLWLYKMVELAIEVTEERC